jgi:hypothetical protein
MKIYKYHATRSLSGGLIESRQFMTKADAVKWVKSSTHARVRLQSENREIVFSKGY